jgi:hypothetical protein
MLIYLESSGEVRSKLLCYKLNFPLLARSAVQCSAVQCWLACGAWLSNYLMFSLLFCPLMATKYVVCKSRKRTNGHLDSDLGQGEHGLTQ